MKKSIIVAVLTVIIVSGVQLKGELQQSRIYITPQSIQTMSTTELQAVTPSELQALTPAQVEQLPVEHLQQMKPEQLKALQGSLVQLEASKLQELQRQVPALQQLGIVGVMQEAAAAWEGKPIDVRPDVTGSTN